MSINTRPMILALAALAAAPTLAPAGPSAHDLVIRVLDAYESRLADIETVTITQTMMGMESQLRMEKTVVDGHATLMTTGMSFQGRAMPMPEGAEKRSWATPFASQRALADHATLDGSETVNGHACHVVVVEDLGSVDFMQPPAMEQAGEVEMKSGRFLVDEKDLVIRRMELSGEMQDPEGAAQPITLTMTFDDYREVGGYLHPFHTTMSATGVMEAEGADMDPEEMAANLAQAKEQMATMPESMKGMMKAQIERLEAMLEGGGMTMEVIVSDVAVNEAASSQ